MTVLALALAQLMFFSLACMQVKQTCLAKVPAVYDLANVACRSALSTANPLFIVMDSFSDSCVLFVACMPYYT